VERAVFVGIVDEMSMRVKILKEKMRNDPDSIESVLGQIESLEDEVLRLFGELKAI